MQGRDNSYLEIGVAIVVALVGAFFVYQASSIRPALNDPIGPKVLPMFLALALIAGGGLIALQRLWGRTVASGDGYGFAESNIGRIAAVIGCGAIYVATFWACGYFVATFVTAVLILLAFGNRNIVLILIVAALAAAIYQFVFMGLMGLYDPAGKLVDLRNYTNWISGAQ